jgi:hypothetical protein
MTLMDGLCIVAIVMLLAAFAAEVLRIIEKE